MDELVKEYGFKTKQEYFEYIIDSKVNGQSQQVRDLFNQMDNQFKSEFLTYAKDYETFLLYGVYAEETHEICIQELLKEEE